MPQDDFDDLLHSPRPVRRRGVDKRSEKAILNDTLVDVSALPRTIAWRNNTGQAWQGERLKFYPGTSIPVPPGIVVLKDARTVNFGLPGSPDILGATCGKPLGIEVKDQDGRQSGIQRNFQAAWEKAGGIYLLVRSAREAVVPIRDILSSFS